MVVFFIAMAFSANEVTVVQGVVCDFFGTPLGGAQVRLVGSGDQESLQANTDASGRFSFRAAPVGKVRVTVTYSGFAVRERYLQLVAGDRAELLVTLVPGSIVDLPPTLIEGTVRSNSGLGLAGAKVVAVCDFLPEARVETQTDNEGHYTMSLSAPGQYTVSASADGYVTDAFTVVLKSALPRINRVVDFGLRATKAPR
jgi:hypothetical protein